MNQKKGKQKKVFLTDQPFIVAYLERKADNCELQNVKGSKPLGHKQIICLDLSENQLIITKI